MARKASPPKIIEAEPIDAKQVKTDLLSIDTLAEEKERVALVVQQIGERYGIDLPRYERDLFVERAGFHLAQSAQSMLQAGVILLAIKQAEGHGNFMRICDERLHMAPATARRMMQASIKFGGAAGTKMLANLATGEGLSKGKLFELMTLDDETFNDLAEGELDELKLDDIACMSVTELRKAVRELKATDAAKDELIAEKDKKINKLSSAKKLKVSIDEQVTDLITELETELADVAANVSNEFFVRVPAVVNAFVEALPSDASVALRARGMAALQASINAAFEKVIRTLGETQLDLRDNASTLDFATAFAELDAASDFE
jgi:hypothetical protein